MAIVKVDALQSHLQISIVTALSNAPHTVKRRRKYIAKFRFLQRRVEAKKRWKVESRESSSQTKHDAKDDDAPLRRIVGVVQRTNRRMNERMNA